MLRYSIIRCVANNHTCIRNLLTGYGFDWDSKGDTSNFVDSGLSTFMNHGCNKTFNFGSIFYVLDHKAGLNESDYDYLMLSEEEVDPNNNPNQEDGTDYLFNPLLDRHLEHSFEGSIEDITKGKELFSNYVHYYSAESWRYGIEELRSQCRHETIGTVVQIERVER